MTMRNIDNYMADESIKQNTQKLTENWKMNKVSEVKGRRKKGPKERQGIMVRRKTVNDEVVAESAEFQF